MEELGGRIIPIECRSCGIPDLARWERRGEPGAAPSIDWKGEPSRKGKWLRRSSGAAVEGTFMGADLGMTSGRTGSMSEGEEGGGGLGVAGGLVSSLRDSSSTFLLVVDKSSGWFLPRCSPPSFSENSQVTRNIYNIVHVSLYIYSQTDILTYMILNMKMRYSFSDK